MKLATLLLLTAAAGATAVLAANAPPPAQAQPVAAQPPAGSPADKPDAASPGKQGPAKRAQGMPLNGKLAAVDGAAKTITLEGKERGRTFLVTSQTRISKEGKPATLGDLKVGEKVGGYARQNTNGLYELTTLNQGSQPSAPSKEKAGRKKAAAE